MGEDRARAADLVMHEAVPFGQHYSYRTRDPLEVVLAPGYFRAEARRLKPGDEIKLIRIEECDGRETVADFAICTVMSSDPAGVLLEPMIRRGLLPVASRAPDGRDGGRGRRDRYRHGHTPATHPNIKLEKS